MHLVRHWLGIDKAIAFTILGRGWAGMAGLATVVLVARFLSPAEQGYYYTFGSLIALQIVFELGFSLVILQMASHERVHLEIANDGSISGDPVAHGRLASVLQKTVRWYACLAALLLTTVVTAGLHFFSVNQQSAAGIHWRAPWACDVIAATCMFLLDPILSFIEGCGFVADVAQLRLVQSAVGSIAAWLVLITHHGLFAPAATIAGYAIVTGSWLFHRQRRLLLPLLKYPPRRYRIVWMKEVWPFQWRIAASWLCGYFIFQLYNPVLFTYKGAVVAGQMGMSLTLGTALTSVAISWINTKAAPFGAMIAKKDYQRLDRLFFRSAKQAFCVCTVGAVTIWLLALLLNRLHSPYAHRILGPLPLGILLINTCLGIPIFAQATYLRAHKQEKFLLSSVLGALLVGLSTYFLGRTIGVMGVVVGSLLVTIIVGLPMATYIFLKYRKLWHSA